MFDYIFAEIPDGEEKSKRIITDHVRASCFLISDGVVPGNTDRAYILRRLLRAAIRHAKKSGLETVANLVDFICEKYKGIYELNSENIKSVISGEENKFLNTLEKGLKEFEKGERDAFLLFTSYGFPVEMTLELAREKGESIDIDLFNQKMKEHQDKSQAGAEQKFKGGLAGTSEKL
ncbi:MAG: alanine--tRNA ligase-related protein [Candidatus Paceibacterota bacterium]